jgi:hypothetical protein
MAKTKAARKTKSPRSNNTDTQAGAENAHPPLSQAWFEERYSSPNWRFFLPPFGALNLAVIAADTVRLGARTTDDELNALFDAIRAALPPIDQSRVDQVGEIQALAYRVHEAADRGFTARKGLTARFRKGVFYYAAMFLMADHFHKMLCDENQTTELQLQKVAAFGGAMWLYALAKGEQARDATTVEVNYLEAEALKALTARYDLEKKSVSANDARLQRTRDSKAACIELWKKELADAALKNKRANKSEFARKMAKKYGVTDKTIREKWLQGL